MTARSSIGMLALLALVAFGCGPVTEEETRVPARAWSPDAPPADPRVLGEGWLSTVHSERDFSLSPERDEFFFTLMIGRNGVLLTSRKEGAAWSEPEVLPFSGTYGDLEPFLTPDGSRLYFASSRPLEPGGEPKDYDLWFVDREADEWMGPHPVGAPVNTEGNEFYPSLTASGALYFTARREGGKGGEDIWRSEPAGNGFAEPQSISAAVNTEHDEFNAWISPDETVLLFSSFGREDGLGGGDLYVSTRDDDGEWREARNLGAPINSPALDYCPFVTPDGRAFVFSSRRSRIVFPPTEPYDYRGLIRLLSGVENGNGDLFWMGAPDWGSDGS